MHTSFTGPLKVFDVSNNLNGRSVTIDVFKDKINPEDVVLIYTNYDFKLYNSSESIPESITLTYEAAEYLASIPVNAFGTDAFSVDTSDDNDPINSESSAVRAAPVPYHEAGHYVFEVYYNSKDILDTQPYSITIKPNEDYLGQVASEGDGLETGIVNSDQMVKAVIIKSLAGYACEKIIDPNRSDEPLGAEEDFDYSKRLLKRWNPVNKTLDNLITEAISLAGKLWPGIDLIANELLVKKTISGLELEILELKVQAILGLIDKKEASKIIKGLEQFR